MKNQVFVLLVLSIYLSNIAESADPVELKYTETGYVCLSPNEPNVLRSLPKLYIDGKWDALQDETKKLLARLKNKNSSNISIDAHENYYSIVMVTDAAFEKETIIRYLHHDPRGEPFNRTLPGLEWDKYNGQLFQIFLTDGTHQLASLYEFEKVPDLQRQKELTGFVTTLVTGLPPLGDLRALVRTKTLGCPAPVYAIVHAVTIVKERGTVLIADTAVSVTTRRAFEAVRKKARLVVLKYKNWSPHVPTLAANVTSDVEDALSRCLSAGEGIAEWSCWSELRKAAKGSVERYLEANPSLTKQDIEAALIVEKELLEAIPTGSDKIQLVSFYRNVPKRHISFALLSAAIFEESNTPIRAKVEEGTVVQDPLPNALTMGIVNIHPCAYDPESEKIQWAERLRLFAGVTLTPEIGLGIGGGILLFRNVSLNLGYARMLIDTPGKIGLDQEVLLEKEPLDRDTAKVWFFGGSYSFD